jgi:hypothetical protein
MYVCMYVCMYVWAEHAQRSEGCVAIGKAWGSYDEKVCTYECMLVCVYLHDLMYACMYVCMYVNKTTLFGPCIQPNLLRRR